MTVINNVNDLRTELGAVFTQLKEGDIKAKDAKELANLAGKMINSAKVELDYHAMRKDEKAKISFLEVAS